MTRMAFKVGGLPCHCNDSNGTLTEKKRDACSKFYGWSVLWYKSKAPAVYLSFLIQNASTVDLSFRMQAESFESWCIFRIQAESLYNWSVHFDTSRKPHITVYQNQYMYISPASSYINIKVLLIKAQKTRSLFSWRRTRIYLLFDIIPLRNNMYRNRYMLIHFPSFYSNIYVLSQYNLRV